MLSSLLSLSLSLNLYLSICLKITSKSRTVIPLHLPATLSHISAHPNIAVNNSHHNLQDRIRHRLISESFYPVSVLTAVRLRLDDTSYHILWLFFAISLIALSHTIIETFSTRRGPLHHSIVTISA